MAFFKLQNKNNRYGRKADNFAATTSSHLHYILISVQYLGLFQLSILGFNDFFKILLATVQFFHQNTMLINEKPKEKFSLTCLSQLGYLLILFIHLIFTPPFTVLCATRRQLTTNKTATIQY